MSEAGLRSPAPVSRRLFQPVMIHPAVALLSVLLIAVLTVSTESLQMLVAIALSVFLFFAIADLPHRKLLKQMLAVDGFIIATLILLPFTTPGTPVAALFGLGISAEGITLAFAIALKAKAVMLFALTLLHGRAPESLGGTLLRLRVPEKFVLLLLFTARYVSVLTEEYQRLRQAMTARGFRPGLNRHTLATFGNLTGMLLVNATDRAGRVQEAMRMRGFQGRFFYDDLPPFSRTDRLFVIGTGLFAATVLCSWLYHAAA